MQMLKYFRFGLILALILLIGNSVYIGKIPWYFLHFFVLIVTLLLQSFNFTKIEWNKNYSNFNIKIIKQYDFIGNSIEVILINNNIVLNRFIPTKLKKFLESETDLTYRDPDSSRKYDINIKIFPKKISTKIKLLCDIKVNGELI